MILYIEKKKHKSPKTSWEYALDEKIPLTVEKCDFPYPFEIPSIGHNFLRIRIVDPPTPEQYLHSRGANIVIFHT